MDARSGYGIPHDSRGCVDKFLDIGATPVRRRQYMGAQSLGFAVVLRVGRDYGPPLRRGNILRSPDEVPKPIQEPDKKPLAAAETGDC
jgi:hypothetical protein